MAKGHYGLKNRSCWTKFEIDSIIDLANPFFNTLNINSKNLHIVNSKLTFVLVDTCFNVFNRLSPLPCIVFQISLKVKCELKPKRNNREDMIYGHSVVQVYLTRYLRFKLENANQSSRFDHRNPEAQVEHFQKE